MLSHFIKLVFPPACPFTAELCLPYFWTHSCPGEGGLQLPTWLLPPAHPGYTRQDFSEVRGSPKPWQSYVRSCPSAVSSACCPPGDRCRPSAAPSVKHWGLQTGHTMELQALTVIEKKNNFLSWTIVERSFKVSSASVG